MDVLGTEECPKVVCFTSLTSGGSVDWMLCALPVGCKVTKGSHWWAYTSVASGLCFPEFSFMSDLDNWSCSVVE